MPIVFTLIVALAAGLAPGEESEYAPAGIEAYTLDLELDGYVNGRMDPDRMMSLRLHPRERRRLSLLPDAGGCQGRRGRSICGGLLKLHAAGDGLCETLSGGRDPGHFDEVEESVVAPSGCGLLHLQVLVHQFLDIKKSHGANHR